MILQIQGRNLIKFIIKYFWGQKPNFTYKNRIFHLKGSLLDTIVKYVFFIVACICDTFPETFQNSKI